MDGSILVLTTRRNWKHDLIKFGPKKEKVNDCGKLEQKCHGMTEMILAGRKCVALG